MDIKKARQLMDNYPEIFFGFGTRMIPEGAKHHPDFSAGNGWYELIQDLCYHIEEIQRDAHCMTKIQCVQLKEKFGGLRFYYNIKLVFEHWSHKYFNKINYFARTQMCKRGFATAYWKFDDWRQKHIYMSIQERVHVLVRKKESESYTICEICGQVGKRCTPNGRWVETLCEEHEKETKNRKEW